MEPNVNRIGAALEDQVRNELPGQKQYPLGVRYVAPTTAAQQVLWTQYGIRVEKERRLLLRPKYKLRRKKLVEYGACIGAKYWWAAVVFGFAGGLVLGGAW